MLLHIVEQVFVNKNLFCNITILLWGKKGNDRASCRVFYTIVIFDAEVRVHTTKNK